jgi:glutamate synthase (NADPH/NADH) large chain
MRGQASHQLLQTAIEALTCMTHRGGISADGRTGDGCGLLLKKPDSFLKAVARELFNTEMTEHFAVGMVFLSQDAARADIARKQLSQSLIAEGLVVVGWRVVPTDSSVCGPIALESLPQIEQVFVNAPGADARQLATKLYVARRKAEIALASDGDFYVSSLSE